MATKWWEVLLNPLDFTYIILYLSLYLTFLHNHSLSGESHLHFDLQDWVPSALWPPPYIIRGVSNLTAHAELMDCWETKLKVRPKNSPHRANKARHFLVNEGFTYTDKFEYRKDALNSSKFVSEIQLGTSCHVRSWESAGRPSSHLLHTVLPLCEGRTAQWSPTTHHRDAIHYQRRNWLWLHSMFAVLLMLRLVDISMNWVIN